MERTDIRAILPATARQKITMTRLYMALGNNDNLEQQPMTLGEAGREIRSLIKKLTLYEREKKI